MCVRWYMFRQLSGHPQVVKLHKNQNYNCSISYGRSDWDRSLWCYKTQVNKKF